MKREMIVFQPLNKVVNMFLMMLQEPASKWPLEERTFFGTLIFHLRRLPLDKKIYNFNGSVI